MFLLLVSVAVEPAQQTTVCTETKPVVQKTIKTDKHKLTGMLPRTMHIICNTFHYITADNHELHGNWVLRDVQIRYT